MSTNVIFQEISQLRIHYSGHNQDTLELSHSSMVHSPSLHIELLSNRLGVCHDIERARSTTTNTEPNTKLGGFEFLRHNRRGVIREYVGK